MSALPREADGWGSLRNASELPVRRVIVHFMAREADLETYWENGTGDNPVELPPFSLSTLPPGMKPLVRTVPWPQFAEMANQYERKVLIRPRSWQLRSSSPTLPA